MLAAPCISSYSIPQSVDNSDYPSVVGAVTTRH